MKKTTDKTDIKKAQPEKDSMKAKEDSQLHKGYNEKNPAQPQGAFTPDSKTGKK